MSRNEYCINFSWTLQVSKLFKFPQDYFENLLDDSIVSHKDS